MITCKRLTAATEVIDNWFFFRDGFRQFANKHNEDVDLLNMLKITCTLASSERDGFVAIVYNNEQPEGFGIMEDVSPIFSKERTFLCRAFWHQSGNTTATVKLMDCFETWALENNVTSYTVTTRRNTGAAIRCFQSEKYGFRRNHVMFVKTL